MCIAKGKDNRFDLMISLRFVHVLDKCLPPCRCGTCWRRQCFLPEASNDNTSDERTST